MALVRWIGKWASKAWAEPQALIQHLPTLQYSPHTSDVDAQRCGSWSSSPAARPSTASTAHRQVEQQPRADERTSASDESCRRPRPGGWRACLLASSGLAASSVCLDGGGWARWAWRRQRYRALCRRRRLCNKRAPGPASSEEQALESMVTYIMPWGCCVARRSWACAWRRPLGPPCN